MKSVTEFFRQLWKRRVVQFGALYLGAAWVLLQVAVVVEQTLELPNWIDQSVLVILVLGFPLALILAWAQETQATPETQKKKPTDVETGDASPTNDKVVIPSIAVLPFQCNIGDEETTLTADGLTDDITALLTQITDMNVVPRQVIGQRSGTSQDPIATAQEFNARYAVTGTVRRSGDQLRVLCELIDVNDQKQVWSNRYDRKIEDVFLIQDEIAMGVAGTVGGEIARTEAANLNRTPPEHLGAWQWTRRASAASWNWGRESIAQALSDSKRALEIDSNYALAHSFAAASYGWRAVTGWADDIDLERRLSQEHADTAFRLGLAANDAEAIGEAMEACQSVGNPVRAVQMYEQATEKNSDMFLSYPYGFAIAGVAMAKVGRTDEGLVLIKRYEQTYPADSYKLWVASNKAYVELCRGDYAAAASLLANQPVQHEHNFMCLVVALSKSGRMDDAVERFKKLKDYNSDLSLDQQIDYFKLFHADPKIGEELSNALVELKQALQDVAPSLPSIAVLPFRVTGTDDQEALIADGLTDEVTTMLTQINRINVVPRQVVGHRSKISDDPTSMAKEFNARYALTGSARLAGDRLRVLCELTDITTRSQVWSERYDRKLEDIFDIQDEIAMGVAGTVGSEISRAETAKIRRTPPNKLEAWQIARRASFPGWDWRSATIADALKDALKAVELDPDYAIAHAYVAIWSGWRVVAGWAEDRVAERAQAFHHAEQGFRLGMTDNDAEAIAMSIEAINRCGDPKRAADLYDQAIKKKANMFMAFPYGLAQSSTALANVGRSKEAFALIDEFTNFYPGHNYNIWSHAVRAYAELARLNYARVVDLLSNDPPEYEQNVMCCVVALVNLGRMDDAISQFEKLRAYNPEVSIDVYREYFQTYHVDPNVNAELDGALAELNAAIQIS